MSAGQASNSYLYGGKDGNAASVTAGGNLGAQLNFTNIVNIGRLVLRTGRVTRLQDVPVSMVMVFNPTGNGNVWYAGYDTNAPQIGVGMPIPAGTSVNLTCTDANQLSFTPEVDGNQIYVLAFASGNTVPVTPSNPPAFTTAHPTFTAYNPSVNNATNVPVFQTISVQASAALDPTTVNNTTVTATHTMTATISVDSSNPQLIVVTPTANLDVSTTYTITYGTGIADLNGNTPTSAYVLTFTTASTVGTPDTTPPVLVATAPVAFSSGFNPSLIPTLVFSEAISLSSVNANNITAFLTNNNQPIPNLVFTQSNDLKSIYINNMNLVQSQNYQINVIGGPSGLMDLSGNHFATTYSIPFATSAPAGDVIYSVSGNSYDTLQATSGFIESCIYMNSSRSQMVGTVPIGYTFIVRRVGSPSGNVVFVWERESGGGFYNDFRTLLTISASSISSTSDQTITIIDTSNTHSIQYKDLISVRYDSGGNSSNYILVKVSNYDAFDGANTCSLKTDSNDFDNTFTSADLAGTVTVLA